VCNGSKDVSESFGWDRRTLKLPRGVKLVHSDDFSLVCILYSTCDVVLGAPSTDLPEILFWIFNVTNFVLFRIILPSSLVQLNKNKKITGILLHLLMYHVLF